MLGTLRNLVRWTLAAGGAEAPPAPAFDAELLATLEEQTRAGLLAPAQLAALVSMSHMLDGLKVGPRPAAAAPVPEPVPAPVAAIEAPPEVVPEPPPPPVPEPEPPTAAELAESDDPAARRQAAADPDAPPKVLAALARDPVREVRVALASNPAVRAATLDALAADPDPDVARATLANPATPAGARAALEADLGALRHLRARGLEDEISPATWELYKAAEPYVQALAALIEELPEPGPLPGQPEVQVLLGRFKPLVRVGNDLHGLARKLQEEAVAWAAARFTRGFVEAEIAEAWREVRRRMDSEAVNLRPRMRGEAIHALLQMCRMYGDTIDPATAELLESLICSAGGDMELKGLALGLMDSGEFKDVPAQYFRLIDGLHRSAPTFVGQLPERKLQLLAGALEQPRVDRLQYLRDLAGLDEELRNRVLAADVLYQELLARPDALDAADGQRMRELCGEDIKQVNRLLMLAHRGATPLVKLLASVPRDDEDGEDEEGDGDE